MKVQVEHFLFSPGKKNALPPSQRGTKSKFRKVAPFLPRFLSYPVFRSSFELASPFHWFGYEKFSFVSFFVFVFDQEEEAIENVCLASFELSRVMQATGQSRR